MTDDRDNTEKTEEMTEDKSVTAAENEDDAAGGVAESENDPLREELLTSILSYGKQYNIERISEAYEYAKSLHEGQTRKSGEPYIYYPVAVARTPASCL